MSEMMGTLVPKALPELVNDWSWDGCVAQIDGNNHIVMSTHHPRHGTIHWLVSKANAALMHDWLGRVILAMKQPTTETLQ